MANTKRHKMKPQELGVLSDAELLQIRVRDMGLQIEGTPLESMVARLHEELDARGILFHPTCYLADEWLCPDKVPIIGIPFCLAHPRLKQIEQNMMFEVEGGTDADCMRLLRHETGHALNYAFRLYRRTRWRELFGQFSTRYTDSYVYRPYSKRFVHHLADNYAQAHPDEDFAETFAVWLSPNSRWKQKYAGWPVIRKLNYVDHVVKSIADKSPVNTATETPWAAARMRSTLAAHYERKRKNMGDDFVGHYDPGIKRIFTSPSDQSKEVIKASALIRRHRRHITNCISDWTGQRKYDVARLLARIGKRCDALELHSSSAENDLMELIVFVTTVATRGRFVPPQPKSQKQS
jgi:hypothetical protein